MALPTITISLCWLMVIVGRAAQNIYEVFYTALNTFDLPMIGQGTTPCTLLIRNGKCLEIK